MRYGHYVLRGHKVVPEPDLLKWAAWFETADRSVARDSLNDDVHVSTVFLGLDHQFSAGPPLYFETKIFGGEHDGYCDRYSSWEEAKDGHAKVYDMLLKKQLARTT